MASKLVPELSPCDGQLSTEEPPATSPSLHADFSSSDADAVLCTSDGVHFRVRSELLCRVSAWFQTMFTIPQGPDMDRTEPIPVNESARTLSDVLNIVTGACLPSLDDVDHLENLLAVADKYDMLMLVSLVRLALSSRHPDVSPIRLYGIASRMDWEKEAEGASSRTLTTNFLSPPAGQETGGVLRRTGR